MWRYLYDPLGRRIAKQRLATDGNVAEQTDFTWDGAVLVEQAVTAAGADRQEVVSWNYQPGSFTPLTQAEYTSPRDAPQDQIDERFYAIVTDLIGTPTELTSPDGTLTGHQRQTLWRRNRLGLRRRPDAAALPRPVRGPRNRPVLQQPALLRSGQRNVPLTRPARPHPFPQPPHLRPQPTHPHRPPRPQSVRPSRRRRRRPGCCASYGCESR